MRSLLALWLLFPALSMAQVPAKLGYQGRLLGAEGKPIDGKLSVKFSIFDQASGGTELWSEQQDLVLADGYYSTSLGAGTRVAGDMAAAFDGKERFLELTVQDSPPLAPRQPIDSAAYALVCGSLASPPAGPNLLADTLKLAHIPPGPVTITGNAIYGAWYVFPYDAAKVVISAEPPPDDLLALVQPGKPAWSPYDFAILHVKMSPGGTNPARLLQRLAALDKSAPVTMSAYIKVVAGKLFMGQEGAWQAFSNPTWVRQKATVNTPTSTLGGAYGFGADPSAFTEAYIALPKVEAGGNRDRLYGGAGCGHGKSSGPCRVHTGLGPGSDKRWRAGALFHKAVCSMARAARGLGRRPYQFGRRTAMHRRNQHRRRQHSPRPVLRHKPIHVWRHTQPRKQLEPGKHLSTQGGPSRRARD